MCESFDTLACPGALFCAPRGIKFAEKPRNLVHGGSQNFEGVPGRAACSREKASWFGVPADENLARSGKFSSTGAPGDDVRRPIRSRPETRSGMASRRMMLCSDVEFATRKLRRVGASPPKHSV